MKKYVYSVTDFSNCAFRSKQIFRKLRLSRTFFLEDVKCEIATLRCTSPPHCIPDNFSFLERPAILCELCRRCETSVLFTTNDPGSMKRSYDFKVSVKQNSGH